MQMLDAKEAKAAIAVFVGKNYKAGFLGDKTGAEEELIKHTKRCDRQEVAESTITLLLDRYLAQRGSRLFRSRDELGLALKISENYRPRRAIAERLIKTAAHSGFIGQFPELPHDLLGRDPSIEEVTLLVSNYVNDRACRCECTEKKLLAMIRAYLPEDKSAMQSRRIDRFITRWKRDSL